MDRPQGTDDPSGSDGEHQIEGLTHPTSPHLADPVGQRFGEQPDVRRVDVVATARIVGVVQRPQRVGAQHTTHSLDEVVEPAGVVDQAEAHPPELAAGEHPGVVAGQHLRIEELEPIGAVDRQGNLFRLGAAQAGEQRVALEGPPLEQRLGDPVGEERVRPGAVDVGEQAGDDLVDRSTGHLGDAGPRQVVQREAQVRPHVGAHLVSGEHARNAPPVQMGLLGVLQRVDDERPELCCQRSGSGHW